MKEARAGELFTTRELEILELLGQGKTSKEIALLLNLRVTTIASHRKKICRKLGAHSTAELICYAVAVPRFLFLRKRLTQVTDSVDWVTAAEPRRAFRT
jgi:DNA-binding CsgD family transcriptional regulator